MMNRRTLKLFLTICAIFGVCIALGIGQAQATITGPFDGVGVNYDTAFFDRLTSETIVLLDKDEFNDGTAVGDVTDQWLTVSGYGDIPYQEAYVSWNLTGSGFEARYVAVKDGDTPSGEGVYWLYYVVQLDQYVVNSVGDLIATWQNGAGNISNVALYGTMVSSVPDASVMLLLGSSLLGFAVFTRKRKTS